MASPVSDCDNELTLCLKPDFASIPVAIENGRLVFDNLKKVIIYLLPAGTYTEFMGVYVPVFSAHNASSC